MLKKCIDIKAPVMALTPFTPTHLYVLNWKNQTNRKLLGFDYTLSRLKPRKRLICFALIKNKKKRMMTFDLKEIKYPINYVEKFGARLYILNFHFINYSVTYSNTNTFKIIRYVNFFKYIFFLNKQNFNFFFYALIGLTNRLPLPYWWACEKNSTIRASRRDLINLRSNSKTYLFNFNLNLI